MKNGQSKQLGLYTNRKEVVCVTAIIFGCVDVVWQSPYDGRTKTYDSWQEFKQYFPYPIQEVGIERGFEPATSVEVGAMYTSWRNRVVMSVHAIDNGVVQFSQDHPFKWETMEMSISEFLRKYPYDLTHVVVSADE